MLKKVRFSWFPKLSQSEVGSAPVIMYLRKDKNAVQQLWERHEKYTWETAMQMSTGTKNVGEEMLQLLEQKFPCSLETRSWWKKGKVWGARSSRKELLWTDHNSHFPIPLHCLLVVEEVEESGMDQLSWAWDEGKCGDNMFWLFFTILLHFHLAKNYIRFPNLSLSWLWW